MIDNDRGENLYLQRRLLRVAVAARYAQSLVMGAYSYSQVLNHPFLWVWSILALCPKYTHAGANFMSCPDNEALILFSGSWE